MISCVDIGSTYEFRGLSTDTKPTNVPNGCVFVEMNTGKVFMFNAATHTWVEFG